MTSRTKAKRVSGGKYALLVEVFSMEFNPIRLQQVPHGENTKWYIHDLTGNHIDIGYTEGHDHWIPEMHRARFTVSIERTARGHLFVHRAVYACTRKGWRSQPVVAYRMPLELGATL